MKAVFLALVAIVVAVLFVVYPNVAMAADVSLGTVFGVSAVFWLAVAVAVVVGLVIYLKRRGVLARAAADAKNAISNDVGNAAQSAADKLAGK